jgi:DNA-binding MarR family transcriptional regulator
MHIHVSSRDRLADPSTMHASTHPTTHRHASPEARAAENGGPSVAAHGNRAGDGPDGHGEAARAMSAECLCFRVRRVSRALTRLYDEALRPLGIHATQLTLLNAIAMGTERAIARGAESGALMSRLADVLAMDATTLSRGLKRLETDGLVDVGRMPTDRRVRLVRLTPDGRRLLEAALPRWSEAHARVVGALGAELAADLSRGFDAAVAATAAIQGDPLGERSVGDPPTQFGEDRR